NCQADRTRKSIAQCISSEIYSQTLQAPKILARLRRVPPAKRSKLQRAQEVQHILLLGGGQDVKIRLHYVSFGAVALVLFDRHQQVAGAAVVQEEDALPQTPQRS